MGQSSVQNRSQTGETISTVGVDIGDLILKRNNKEVVFSTWDFGGQVCELLLWKIFLVGIATTRSLWNLRVENTVEYYVFNLTFFS